MQNFEEIKKMADMARSLREHGLAKDSLDAMQQARATTSSDPAVLQQRKEALQEERLAMFERKLEFQLRKVDEVQAQLDQATKKILELTAQLSNVSARVRDVEAASTANISPIPPPQWQPQQWQPPQQQWAPPVERVPEAKPIDRNGVAPADVSVEKFFYFGNKR
jgi:uncharacterized coiled-coil protein SlyX